MNLNHLLNIQNALDYSFSNKDVAGVNCLVLQNGKEIGYWQSGFRDVKKKELYSRDTIVRLYSMSKPVTSVAAFILIERGLLDSTAEVQKYLPEYKDLTVLKNNKIEKCSRPLLVQDLLNMTSGYTYGGSGTTGLEKTSEILNALNDDVLNDCKISTREVAKRLASVPLEFEPGTDYQYGLSADILGAVIEVVSGMKFSDFLKKEIFIPLGMNETDFYVQNKNLPRLANVYKCQSNKDFELFEKPNLGIQPFMNKQPSFESGGAGLCSTIDDYSKFCLMLANKGILNGKRILQEKTVEYFTNAHLRKDLQNCFDIKMPHLCGYTYTNLFRVAIDKGTCNVITENKEFGWDGWLGPYMSVDLKNNLVIVMTMQRTDSGTWELTRKVKNIIYSSL